MDTILLDNASVLSLNVAPDWPMIVLTGIIGCTSFFTTLALIWVTRQNQRSSSNQKKAELHLEWQAEFRDSICDITASATVLHMSWKHKNSDDIHDILKDLEQLYFTQSKIKLLIADVEGSSEFEYLIAKLVNSVSTKAKISTSNLVPTISEIEEKALKIIASRNNIINSALSS
ncbi:hypothetical protein [Vibrio splendidus]|uniref:hypothetical protein n=1 Tax=Vibrio splendidus TaxID=29497 RepID=UPI001E4EA4C9|nr:hypothetical protein [Vibrio splendidus]MCC4861228.1 hypothetical protein [Vibrio splendidus]